MRLHFASPADNRRGPSYMASALAEVHHALSDSRSLSLVLETRAGQIGYFVAGSNPEIVISPLLAHYPDGTLLPTAPALSQRPSVEATWTASVLLHAEALPLRTHDEFEDSLNRTYADPLSGLLRSLLPERHVRFELQYQLQAVSKVRVRRCRRALSAGLWTPRPSLKSWLKSRPAAIFTVTATLVRRGVPAILYGPQPEIARQTSDEESAHFQDARQKLSGPLFAVAITITATGPNEQAGYAQERMQSIVGTLNGLTRGHPARFTLGPIRTRSRRRRTSLLSPADVALLWHPPTATTAAERLSVRSFRELEAPTDFPAENAEDAVPLGRVAFRDDERPVRLRLEDRRRHLYVVGRTGMGKTTLIQSMIAHDMAAGRGLCIIDPHGDLAESVLGLVPKSRTNDVISFDAGLRDGVIGFNPLACRDERQVDQVTSAVVSAFKKINSSWGPRLEDTLRNAVFAVVEQGGTLMTVLRLLGERPFRDATIGRIRDPVVRSFWEHEFSRWSESYRTEAVAAIQNKVRPFLTNTHMRAIVSPTGDGIDLRSIMDSGQILVVNLSKGRVGEDNSTLLGAFLVASLQQAAMTRADMPEGDRRDFFLYVDEFQNFVSGSFATILSEARKFRLSLCCVHQYLAQLDETTAEAVFGNVGSMVAFQVGSDDAESLARQMSQFAGQVLPADLTGLPKYTAYARLLNNGLPSRPLSFRTFSPESVGQFDPERAEIVKRVSVRRYGSAAPQ